MKKLAPILLLAVAVVAIALVSTYLARGEQMDARRQAVDTAWSHVDAALQLRAGVVPALVAALHPSSADERAVLDELLRAQESARSAAMPRDRLAASRQLDAAIRRLFALVEVDPELRFNDKFFRLQERLTVAQERVATERRRYDDAVQNYNALLAEYPLFARWSGHAFLINYFAAPADPASAGQ